MYYASSGAGGAQPNPTGRPGILGQQIGSYPPSGALGRGGPPGFGGRGAGACSSDDGCVEVGGCEMMLSGVGVKEEVSVHPSHGCILR